MASSERDPLRVPEGFWLRGDISNALDHRDIGALFRLLSSHAGASQTRIGTATGLSQGTVCLIMNNSRVVSAIDVLERIADGLAIPDKSRLRLGLAPRGGLLELKRVQKGGHRETSHRPHAGSRHRNQPGDPHRHAPRLSRRSHGVHPRHGRIRRRRRHAHGIYASYAITAHPASSCIWLADYKQAETHARTVLAAYELAAPVDRRPTREAIARIDLSIALAHLGSLDEATAHGSQALSSGRLTRK